MGRWGAWGCLLGLLLLATRTTGQKDPGENMAASTASEAGEEDKDGEKEEEDATKTKPAGRCAHYSENRRAFFGDLHVHTTYSFDAYVFGTRATPSDAYRYAKAHS